MRGHAIRCAAICGLLVTLAGCGTPASPPQAATGASRGQETARSASPSPTRCEEPCTPTRTSTQTDGARASVPSATTRSTGASAPTATRTHAGSTPPYSRDEFGTGWTDPDHNGCDARQDAIRAATSNRVMAGPCKITRADIHDRYTGRTYPAANPTQFDIDHVVALHDAWNSGASSWPRARRVAFANDPADLVLTTASLNRSKGDQDPSEWSPPTHDGACWYVRTYRAIKLRWRLHTTPTQRAAIRRTLATCTGTENR